MCTREGCTGDAHLKNLGESVDGRAGEVAALTGNPQHDGDGEDVVEALEEGEGEHDTHLLLVVRVVPLEHVGEDGHRDEDDQMTADDRDEL
jgi:hypothetical protein